MGGRLDVGSRQLSAVGDGEGGAAAVTLRQVVRVVCFQYHNSCRFMYA